MAGDMAVVWDRAGLESILVNFGDSILLSNIEIHGSGGGMAVQVASSSNSIADNVRIKPRPGGLLGSNADGIHFSFSLFNNHIRNCYVTRTTDDAIGLDSDFVASVSKQTSKRQITATRNFGNRAANGSMMNFVQIATTGEVAGGVLVSQDPPDSAGVNVNAPVTFTFDRDLPILAPGDEMVFADSNMRSGGSTVEDNVVEDITVGRGIYLGGIEDVVIQRNVIRGTGNAGINISEVEVAAGGGGLPSHGVTIQNNAIENVLGPQASGAGLAINNQAGIVVSSNDQNFDFVTTPVNSNISILNNYIGGSGRAGIWVGEINQGAISGNVIVNWNQHPELPVWQTPPYPGDLSQPLVVRFSQGVAQSGNIIQAASPLLTPVTLNPASALLMGTDRSGAFTVSTAVPGFSWVAASQDSWLTLLGGTPGTGTGTVQYAAAPNPTGVPRTGTITVAGGAFSVVQSPMSGLPIASAAGVANAASYSAGTVAPGEIITIFGSNLGPATLAGAMLLNGVVATQIGGTQVLFDGVAAPLVYAAANQVSAIVPYAVHGNSTQMVVSYGSVASAPVTLNVATSAPGLFTADSSGSGQGAFLNTNGAVNGATDPAPKGSLVTLFATGEGLTNPAGLDGKLATAPYPAPILPVMVTIDGVPVEIDYKGAAPGEVAGVMQLNVRVPATARSGNLPVVLRVGAVASKPVTLSVR